MRAVFYGGGDYIENLHLHEEMIALSTSKPRITYIPSSSEYGLVDFPDFVKSFKKIAKCSFVYFPIDVHYSTRLEIEALRSDIIFLSGGNTFSFLQNLRRKKLMSGLRNSFKEGSVLSGLSAGAILLSPNIATASFPKWDCDENTSQIKKWDALNLCNFEFFPHYTHHRRYVEALSKHSQKSKHLVIAAPNGCGLSVDGEKISTLGKCHHFLGGKAYRVNARKPIKT